MKMSTMTPSDSQGEPPCSPGEKPRTCIDRVDASTREPASRGSRIAGLATTLILIVLYLVCPEEWDPAHRLMRIVSERSDLDQMTDGTMTLGQFALCQLRFALHDEGPTYLRIAFWLFPAMAMLAWVFSDWVRLDRLRAMGARVKRHAVLLVTSMALLAGAVSYSLAVKVLDEHPITLGDEYSYLFQARLLAEGRLYAEPPPAGAEAFRNRAFVIGDRRHGIGFGGHPLALSLGVLLGSAYLIPSLCAAVSVILTYRLSTTIYDQTTGLLAAGMAALSPMFIFYHATLLPESTNLVFLLLFLLNVARGARTGARYSWVFAAIALALGMVTRPQTTVMACLPVGIWLLLRKGVVMRARLLPIVILGLGVVAGTVGLWTYAHLVGGEPFGSHLSPGYHHDEVGGAACLGIDSVMLFIRNSLFSLATWIKLNFSLFGWPISLVALWWWARETPKNTWDLLLFASAACIFWLYWIYPLQHEQYFVEAGQILIILSAAGIVTVLRKDVSENPQGTASRVALIVACYLMAFVSVWPFRVGYLEYRSQFVRSVWEPIERAELHHAIVFLDQLGKPMMNCVGGNTPDLDDDVLLVQFFNPLEAAQIAEAFPGRTTYRLSRESEDGPLRLESYEIPILSGAVVSSGRPERTTSTSQTSSSNGMR
jgi:hypothetical protein